MKWSVTWPSFAPVVRAELSTVQIVATWLLHRRRRSADRSQCCRRMPVVERTNGRPTNGFFDAHCQIGRQVSAQLLADRL